MAAALAPLRSALRRLERSRFAPAAPGADVAACLPGRRYWLELVEAGFLVLEGPAVRLTAAGLAAAALCGACGWASCRGACTRPALAATATAEAPPPPRGGHSSSFSTSKQVKKAAISVEIASSDLAIVLEKGPIPGAVTLRGQRRRQSDLYRQRAARALFWAIQRWERTFFEAARPGIDLSRFLEGKKRYWQGGGGAAGYLRGAVVTAEGIAAARAYVPMACPAPTPFSCCADLRRSADHGHATTCPATTPAFGATA